MGLDPPGHFPDPAGLPWDSFAGRVAGRLDGKMNIGQSPAGLRLGWAWQLYIKMYLDQIIKYMCTSLGVVEINCTFCKVWFFVTDIGPEPNWFVSNK